MVIKQNREPLIPARSPEIDLSLQHLQCELRRIDALIRREVRRWQLAGQDPNDAFRGLYVSDAQAEALLERPFASSWGQAVRLDPGEETFFQQELSRAEGETAALKETACRQGLSLRLDQLSSAFNLDRFETDVLLICLAPALDLRYERLYGYLQDDVTRKRPSANLALDLLCPSGPERLLKLSCFSEEAPLFQFHLLEFTGEPGVAQPPLLGRALAVNETAVSWLLGSYQPAGELAPYLTLSQPAPCEADGLLAGPAVSQALQESEIPGLFALAGSDQAGQDAAARLLAARLDLPLLALDLAALAAQNPDAPTPAQAVRAALRDSRLTGAILSVRGWDACLEDGLPSGQLLAELCGHPGLILLSSHSHWHLRGFERQRRVAWIEFPAPDHTRRLELWQHFLPDLPPGGLRLDLLAGQFALNAGQIRDAAAAARDLAAGRGEPIGPADLYAAARQLSTPRLGGLARKISSHYGWDDIVLPEDQVALLKEIVATVRGRPIVLDEWGVGRKLASSRGVTMLFAGPPGTGKTMAAEVIGGELALDLYKIDLSTLVSKYIGETEKNLAQVFAEAESSSAILFFDEADALFGKRSEVRDSHDRYANIEISYLLQRMESYDGVTILATNLRANLDEAFARRLQFVVDFPFPDETYRLRIWQALFPPGVPHASDLDLALLSQRYKLAGGNIRNILVNAAYLAASNGGVVQMDHLLHGARRELQKMGRMVDEGY